MREKGSFSRATYDTRAKTVASRGTATYEAEDRVRQGRGMDPLVDPKGLEKYGPVRGSGNLLVPKGDEFVLEFGVAMPVQTDCDLTGSMGGNVDVFFDVQPKVQNLLVQGKDAVLKRYHVQMCTGAVQDIADRFPYQRSQFEPDNEVERQMGLLYPQRAGGDAPEEYQFGLFAAAYLTDASITKYGLRGYYFVVGDQIGRENVDIRYVERIFGKKAVEIASSDAGNQGLSTKAVASALLEKWHGFFLQVGDSPGVGGWWSRILGAERVVSLPDTSDLAEVQAVIIGLTEGVLTLKNVGEFLKEANVSRERAKLIIEACSKIPMGLQQSLPNFDKIPLAGAKFVSQTDIWPIETKKSGPKGTSAKKSAPKSKKKRDWEL